MDRYKIYGGNKIDGVVDIHGSKNAMLPLMAAAILVKGVTVLHNYPDISDVYYMAAILKHLGCNVRFCDEEIVIDAGNISFVPIPEFMIKRVRASILFMGALVARNGYVEIDYPGGCMIGCRPIDYHIKVLEKLGARVFEKQDKICCESNGLSGADIILDFPSVGATENALIAAACARGVTIIHNAAREPEIVELCEMLSEMGVIIKGAGTSTICIAGNKEIYGAEHTVHSDRIVAGTYICAGMITHGNVCCRMNNPRDMDVITEYIKQMGCSVNCGNDYYEVKSGKYIQAVDYIATKPYPGFPTDMQSQFMSVLSMADAKSTIVENIFEARFRVVPELIKMGADIKISGCKAYINGKKKLKGANIISHELRGGAALIVAGLGAEGKTVLSDNGYIKRGYERIVEDINMLGGRIDCE